jgi:hypothetical protein
MRSRYKSVSHCAGPDRRHNRSRRVWPGYCVLNRLRFRATQETTTVQQVPSTVGAGRYVVLYVRNYDELRMIPVPRAYMKVSL